MPNITNLSSLSVAGIIVPAVGSYSWNESRNAIDCTEIGVSDSMYIAGLRDCSLQFDVFYLEASHEAFESLISTYQSTPSSFLITHATSDTITGTGYVSNFTVNATAGDVIRASFTIQVTGAVTKA